MSNCANHRKCKSKKKNNLIPWLPTFAIAILPKCPFCIMAYSGAMSLCSGKMFYPHANSYSSYLIIGLSLFTLIGIALNYKKKRTRVAILIALIGISLLIISQFFLMSNGLYYVGTALLFFGIWYNGSFNFFYRKYLAGFKWLNIISLNRKNA